MIKENCLGCFNMKEFINAFKPIAIGPLTAKNRIEVSPAEPFLCTKEGLVTEEFTAFTAAMAKGGAGIVTIGDSPVTQYYADKNHFVVNLADPFVVHGLVKVTDAIHRWNALASIELNLRADWHPADLTRDQIRDVIKDFADCAERCRKGGFDMIMLHGGHGHQVSQFYSPYFNKRTDEYGCSTFANRCRFAFELVDAVRERIGYDMAIEWRMSGDELFEEGVHTEEALEFAKAMQSRIDMVQVSAGNMYVPQTMSYTIQPTYMPMATNVHLAERFKQELTIPVATVGSFNMELAEDALSSGKADVVAMIRAFIADPDHVNKAKQGRANEIRPCIRCNQCTGDDPHGCPKPLRCSVNPVSGRNPHFDKIEKAQISKKVVIVGGGAGGMEAARRLAERGHRPVIFEKSEQLGGSLVLAGANTIKGDVRRYAEWSVRMTRNNKCIEIRTGVEAARAIVEAEKPDALIIAVGSDQILPDVPGAKRSDVVLAVDIDTGAAKAGYRVVIVGAGLTGSETALSLARSGHNVTVIDMLPIVDIEKKDRTTATVHKLASAEGVVFIGGVKLCEITESSLIGEDTQGKQVIFDYDTVVLSLGVRPRKSVIEEFFGICDETYVIGDCNNKAGNILSAVREGFYAALNI